jgi:hypothetical protein
LHNPSYFQFAHGDAANLHYPAVDSLDCDDMFCKAKLSGAIEGDIHPSQEKIMKFVKDNCYMLSVYTFVHQWAQDSYQTGHDFKSNWEREW